MRIWTATGKRTVSCATSSALAVAHPTSLESLEVVRAELAKAVVPGKEPYITGLTSGSHAGAGSGGASLLARGRETAFLSVEVRVPVPDEGFPTFRIRWKSR